MKGHTVTITSPSAGDYLIPTHLPSISDQLYIGPMGGYLFQFDKMEHLGWSWYEPGCWPEHPIDHFFVDGKLVYLDKRDTYPSEPIHWYTPGEQFFDRHTSDFIKNATGCISLGGSRLLKTYRVFCYQVGYANKPPSEDSNNYFSVSYLDYTIRLSPMNSEDSLFRIDSTCYSKIRFVQGLCPFEHISPSTIRSYEGQPSGEQDPSWLFRDANPFMSRNNIGALLVMPSTLSFAIDCCRKWFSEVEDQCRSAFAKKKRDDAIFDSLDSLSVTSINSVETINDLQEISGLIPKVGPVKNIRAATKAIAGLYLWYKYVFSTSLSDSKEFLHILRTLPPRKVLERKLLKDDLLGRGSSSDSVELPCGAIAKFHYGAKVRYSFLSNGFLALLERMTVLGLFPSLSDFYAVVPYSFIVDWAVPIGSFIERKQLVDTLSHHRLKHLTASVRANFPLKRLICSTEDPNYSWVADIRFSWFKRVVTDDLDVTISLMFKDPSKHKIEGAALLVSQFVKD